MENQNKKSAKYKRLYNQIEELTQNINSSIARMATINAILYHKMSDFFWVGFYLLEKDKLVVGPYQGPLACLTLKKDTGVCWSGVNKKKSIIVSNVHEFPGHIACDARSQSELVVPLYNNKEIVGVLDIDSSQLNNFDETDSEELEKINQLIYK